MSALEAVYLENRGGDLDKLSSNLDHLERHSILQAPWSAYPYRPEVKFCLAHGNDRLYLKYYVKEKSLRALTSTINGRVWEDSCVECFIGFDEKGYYNFEFNCIGTPMAAFGPCRNDRELLPASVLQEIKYHSVITNDKSEGQVYWELTLVIPLHVFCHHSFHSLKNKECRINFYKCGDLLPEPHYLSWMPLQAEEPDFHLPLYFGNLVFK